MAGVDGALPPEVWLPLAAAHAERADALTAVWRAARAAGRKHAIEDFLFTYYPTRIAHLRRWHPGAGVALALPDGGTLTSDGEGLTSPDGGGAADPTASGNPGGAGRPATGTDAPDPEDRTAWRWHRTDRADGVAPNSGPRDVVTLDREAFLADRGDTVRYVRELLTATASRPGTFGCFGLHEWAMVYRNREAGRDQRHPLPLRLGHEGTDAVVEANPVRCSHFDAFRFFTPEATSRNQLRPTRAAQVGMEQPGCLHANMDLYKWCLKLGPAVPGDLLLDAFELARDIRWTDMAASPYDVSEYGVAAVRIETPDGKAEYVRRQRDFARRSGALRQRLLRVCDAVLDTEFATEFATGVDTAPDTALDPMLDTVLDTP
ncbi:3-methyladenine DNA glycosylase [Promicromonospora sp. NPDC059942]|uniref:3-methyladenine DNA glycosylase n=1 Tax=Promicromonospora sp. NPDC059942 TaxID=3347009 RepID=UPI00365D1781